MLLYLEFSHELDAIKYYICDYKWKGFALT